MRVLFVLSALLIFTGCTETQGLTGPWEMWVIVSEPSTGDVWQSRPTDGRIVYWAAVPGETVRCDLIRNGEKVMEIFDWSSIDTGVYTVSGDLSTAGKGNGFQIMIIDDQGFYGVSEEFIIR